MQQHEIKSLFDQQAASYDTQWLRMAPVRDALHFLMGPVFTGLPSAARVLCVGAGTGVELAYLAHEFPGWHFTAVEPSGPMLEVCRQRALAEGYAERCQFHEGYLDSLPSQAPYHGATCLLVSQFFLDHHARTAFFRGIAERLAPGAVLASSDLASDIHAPGYEPLLRVWLDVMSSAGVQPEMVERVRVAYAKDVAVLPAARVAEIIATAGFAPPVQFFQAGLMHAWFARRI